MKKKKIQTPKPNTSKKAITPKSKYFNPNSTAPKPAIEPTPIVEPTPLPPIDKTPVPISSDGSLSRFG